MNNKKEITMEDVKKSLMGLDPIIRKNLLAFKQGKSTKEIYDFINHFKKAKGLNTKEGMANYIKAK